MIINFGHQLDKLTLELVRGATRGQGVCEGVPERINYEGETECHDSIPRVAPPPKTHPIFKFRLFDGSQNLLMTGLDYCLNPVNLLTNIKWSCTCIQHAGIHGWSDTYHCPQHCSPTTGPERQRINSLLHLPKASWITPGMTGQLQC